MSDSRSGITVVIGAGVNELVCAHYLARAGRHVTVLQPDAAETEHASVAGWVPAALVRDLALDVHGFRTWQPDPWLTLPLTGGGRLELAHNVARAADAIRCLSARDAAQWPAFCDRMHRLSQLLAEIYVRTPPDPLGKAPADWLQLADTALRARRLGRQGIEDLMRIVPMSVADLLDDWFESDALKGALGAAGILHLHQGPRSGGTAALLLHHHVGNPAGVFRPPPSNIESVLTQMPGVEMRAGEVRRIEVSAGRVSAVTLATGETIATQLVVSGADPQRTLLDLLDSGWLPADYLHALERLRCRGVVASVRLTLDRPSPLSRFAIGPSLDYLERAYDDAKYGAVSRAPYLEATCGPHGERTVDVHVQYAPYELADGEWSTEKRAALADLAIEILARHAPEIGSSVVERNMLSPRDLEEQYDYPAGQLYHLEPTLDQMAWMRPLAGWARYRTPVAGLYLCGPATHPASVSGICGYNAARQIMRDLK
jgi:phytoene dehydrogenase-like protein